MSSPSSSSTCRRACGCVIATREDPMLPLARLRARGELTELRAADLRFSPDEAADFLGRVMGLELTTEDIAALESRTEGWIAGLQLAALSMQGQKDIAGFIHSFTGSHRFVLDYLAEEVLRHQPEGIQAFLLRTSILDRFCGSLCDALMQGDSGPRPDVVASGQETLEYLERANLFIVPLDGERRWYRYHRLFGELLRQRLEQSLAADKAGGETGLAALHIRASSWYEDNGLPIEAFRHAAAAADIDRAERLIDSREMPLHFRGAVIAILDWLASLPADRAGRASIAAGADRHDVSRRRQDHRRRRGAPGRGAGPPGRRAGRSDTRPHRPHRRRQGHPRSHSLPAGRHHGPVSPGARVPAPRRPSLPLARPCGPWPSRISSRGIGPPPAGPMPNWNA